MSACIPVNCSVLGALVSVEERIIIIIITIIIIALKGAIRDFLQSPHCAANCIQHVRAILCKSRATH